MRYHELFEFVVPSSAFSVAKRALNSLSPLAQNAILHWEHANWIGGPLEQHFESMDEVAQEIIEAFKPVRQTLPETITLYRGVILDSSYSTWQKKILESWTSDRRIAEIFAGLRDEYGRALFYPVMPQSEIDRAVSKYEDTGFLKIGRRRYILNKEHPRFYNIYDDHEMLTDGDDIRRELESTARDNAETNQNRKARCKLFEEEVSRDRIIWLSNVRGCKEFIVKKN